MVALINHQGRSDPVGSWVRGFVGSWVRGFANQPLLAPLAKETSRTNGITV